MRARLLTHLARSQDAAVAPTVALALFGLIAVGGIAFDYARMATLDTELQAAADQAALAAATQLDGKDDIGGVDNDAITRATAAAQDLISNDTRFANDAEGQGKITIESVTFFSDYTRYDNNTPTTDPTEANFVRVQTSMREAFFALTPIVEAFSSGELQGTAIAGLRSALCKVPPVMMCNPQETGGNTSFSVNSLIGKGLNLVSVGNGGGAWAPGNFGYLDNYGGSNGAPGLREGLGWKSPPGDCSPQTGVDTKPGASVSVTDALNTRFDIYDTQSCPSGGSCPPSINSVKDLLRPDGASGNNTCRIHNSGWQEASQADKRYLPNATNAATATTLTPDAMGHPRDMCHAAPSSATGYCSGTIGDGVWDRNAYFRANYGWNSSEWQTNTGLGATPKRYDVYQWEIEHRGQTIGGRTILAERAVGSLRDHDGPVCSNVQTPSYGTGIVPGEDEVDRRRISVAVINCTANNVNGNSTNVPVEEWIDVFLVEPSFSRGAATSGSHGRSATHSGDVYVEVIDLTSAGANGATAGQVTRRDVPYLIE